MSSPTELDMADGALSASKNNIIGELFVKTADQTYVVARWCFLNRLILDFYWNAAQALERYLKASLLFNGRSAISDDPKSRNYGHNIERLYASVAEYASDLLPSNLTKPDRLKARDWRDEAATATIARFNFLGDPSNRYNLYGFSQPPEDLHRLDALVFAIRRLAVNLAGSYLGGRGSDPSLTNELILRKNPRWQPHGPASHFAKLSSSKATAEVKSAALTQNEPFTNDDYEHRTVPAFLSGSNPVLYRAILIHAKPSSRLCGEDLERVIALSDWVLHNIQMPPEAREELRQARAKLMSRLSIERRKP